MPLPEWTRDENLASHAIFRVTSRSYSYCSGVPGGVVEWRSGVEWRSVSPVSGKIAKNRTMVLKR